MHVSMQYAFFLMVLTFCRSIIPESSPSSASTEGSQTQLYAHSNALSAPQLSSSTTQTSPETDAAGSKDDKTPIVSPRGNSESDVNVADKQVFKKPATPAGKMTKVGRFSIGPVKEVPVPSAGEHICIIISTSEH